MRRDQPGVDVAEFRVMASATQVQLVGAVPGTAGLVERRLRDLEQRWSRFLPTSDITVLNHSQGSWVPVSDDTVGLVRTMVLAAQITDGAYDPTFLHQLLSAGYTTSIEDPSRITVAVETRGTGLAVADVLIDATGRRVQLPPGLSLDPGGIGKGYAADLAVTEALAAGLAEGVLVSIGGDIAAAGATPDPCGWIIDVEHPLDPSITLITLAVSAGGVTTSSTRSRRWTHGGVEHHHVIDPATGVVSHTDLAAVTVVADAGWRAEAHATAALLAGASGAIDHLVRHGLAGLAVGLDGSVQATPDLVTPTADHGKTPPP